MKERKWENIEKELREIKIFKERNSRWIDEKKKERINKERKVSGHDLMNRNVMTVKLL